MGREPKWSEPESNWSHPKSNWSGAQEGTTRGRQQTEVWKSSTPPQTVMVWCLFAAPGAHVVLLGRGLAGAVGAFLLLLGA